MNDAQRRTIEYAAKTACVNLMLEFDGEDENRLLDDRVLFLSHVIHRLEFERRLALLTEKQLENMAVDFTPQERTKIEGTTGAVRRRIIRSYARTRYFTDCAWIAYLNGDEPNAPCEP